MSPTAAFFMFMALAFAMMLGPGADHLLTNRSIGQMLIGLWLLRQMKDDDQ